MFSVKYLFVIVICVQATKHSNANNTRNVTDDAEMALNSLYGQIDSASRIVSIAAPNLLTSYVNEAAEIILQQLGDDVEYFSVIVQNISLFNDENIDGNDCMEPLGVYLDLKNYHVDVVSNEEPIYKRLCDSALADVRNTLEKYSELFQAYLLNCVQYTANCEATSNFIVAEVGRVLPAVRRIPFQLLIDTHYFGNKFLVNWEFIHTILMMDYNIAVRNATSCLATKIKQTTFNSTSEIPSNVNISIAYESLLEVSKNAYLTSVQHVSTTYLNTVKHYGVDSRNTVSDVLNVRIRANNTANAILNLTRDFNVTTDCTLSLVESPAYDEQWLDTLVDQLDGIIKDLNTTYMEAPSFGLQIGKCYENNDLPVCQILSEKMASKTVEIPWLMTKVETSTSVLFYQAITGGRENGTVQVWQTAEVLLDSLNTFKSCVQHSL
ncbi:hypothetical protein NQ318_014075 [Aromia moschata]|uniref:Uncharacterized protein n=1 Tax=Aromia moschata TaxID=1265417 RepID=A0AAV8Z051_9CUCU|nr:hypothetical protein NQ318_014075 [Aromia moschata]